MLNCVGYIDCLLPLYTQAAENSLLHLVIDAVSLAIAGRSSRRSFHLGQSAFGKALARTKKAIEDPIESLQDETLIAVLFLGLYEVSTRGSWTSTVGVCVTDNQ